MERYHTPDKQADPGPGARSNRRLDQGPAKLEELTKLAGTRQVPRRSSCSLMKLQDLFALSSKSAAPDGAEIVKRALLYNRIQCVGTVTPVTTVSEQKHSVV